MELQDILHKINFKQPKYLLPLFLYPGLLFTGYFVIDMFNFEKADTSKGEKTEYINDHLPSVNVRGDGIGNKMDNLRNSFGNITDASAVANVERDDEKQFEEYNTKYTDEERAKLEAELNAKTNKPSQGTSTVAMSNEEQDAIAALEKALADSRNEAVRKAGVLMEEPKDELQLLRDSIAKLTAQAQGKISIPTPQVVTAPSEEEEPVAVVKKVKMTSDYFNTIANADSEPLLIKAIVDEDVKAHDGSVIRLRVLDEMEIGEGESRMVVPKGAYLYAKLGGFSKDRVTGTVESISRKQ